MVAMLFLSVTTFATNPILDGDGTSKQEMATALDAEGFDVTPFLGMTMDDFLTMTPKQYKELTGEKLGVKKSIALKVAQKKVKKEMGGSGKPKSQLVALLLAIFVGGLGIHRFYLGYTTIGIIQILTLGGCGIWALIDLIRIVLGDLGPADGSSYDPEL